MACEGCGYPISPMPNSTFSLTISTHIAFEAVEENCQGSQLQVEHHTQNTLDSCSQQTCKKAEHTFSLMPVKLRTSNRRPNKLKKSMDTAQSLVHLQIRPIRDICKEDTVIFPDISDANTCIRQKPIICVHLHNHRRHSRG
jgi:hypothetical protein